MRSVFFQPPEGWVGDVIPYEEDGKFYLYYLLEDRIDYTSGTPWALATATDLTNIVDQGVVLHAGSSIAPDFNAYTGSVVRNFDGKHHLFYTAQNPSHLGADGLPVQVIMKAVSCDGMTTWEKVAGFKITPPETFETADWRDPFVFYDPETHLWRMLVAARRKFGASRRKGLIAQLVSKDLETWANTEPFWNPTRLITHECPEVFRWGEWWYLIYSEFSDSFCTRYRMSKTLEGPWIRPTNDSVDTRAFYAAKSVEHNGRRYFFGWIATRDTEQDDGAWEWAGTMSVCEATRQFDGTLAFRLVPEKIAQFSEVKPISWRRGNPCVGKQDYTSHIPLTLNNPDGHSTMVTKQELPSQCLIKIEFELIDASEFSVLLRCSEDGERGYEIRIEPRRQRMVFDRWPRKITGTGQWQVSGDIPYFIELERPCSVRPGKHDLLIVIEDTLCVANLDSSVMMSTRIYDHKTGNLGLSVDDGSVEVQEIKILCQPDLGELENN